MLKNLASSVAAGSALLCCLAGCGAGAGDVAGVVKYRGQPLAGGTITFYDAANTAMSSGIDEEGKYEVKQVAAGPAKIAIATPINIQFGSPLPGGKTATKKTEFPDFPGKYTDPEKSGLSLEVKSGSQTHNISLD